VPTAVQSPVDAHDSAVSATAGLICAADAVGASAARPATMIDSSQAAGARVIHAAYGRLRCGYAPVDIKRAPLKGAP
jgi:hypothetical protein